MIDWSNSKGAVPADGQKPIVVNMTSQGHFLSDIDLRMRTRRGFTVATLNLDHIVKIKRHPAFRDAYAAHTHITADGNPVVWLSRLSGRKIDLLPGSELILPVIDLAVHNDVPVALLGTTQESLAHTAARLNALYPKLRIVAQISPPMGFDPTSPQADDCIDALRASGARLCFLALGAPKQELFAVHAHDALPEVGFLSIGAGLDFISGAQTRAPRWVRNLAAEWLWRLAQNPRRLAARYGACIVILPQLFLDAMRSRAATDGES